MVKTKKLSTALLLIAGSLLPLTAAAQQKSTVTVTAKADAPTINKHIYGHFSEHLGRCIYDGFYDFV